MDKYLVKRIPLVVMCFGGFLSLIVCSLFASFLLHTTIAGRGCAIGEFRIESSDGADLCDRLIRRYFDECGKSDELLSKVLVGYRQKYPESTISDEELLSSIRSAAFPWRKRRSGNYSVKVRSCRKALSRRLVDLYVKALAEYTENRNLQNEGESVDEISADVMKLKGEVEDMRCKLHNARTCKQLTPDELKEMDEEFEWLKGRYDKRLQDEERALVRSRLKHVKIVPVDPAR